jgi:hypothetical protein
MTRNKKFVYIEIVSLMSFLLSLIFINSSFSIKTLALDEDSVVSGASYNSELSIENNNSMMLPGSNMTFGASLDNAKMHLIEAIVDIEDNNIDGALMQLNMTGNAIKMHEQEIADMMLMMKKMKETEIR